MQRTTGAMLSYFNIVIKNVVMVLYTPFLLSFLGQSQYGLYQMTNSLMMTLSLLSMGMGIAYVRFYVKYKSSYKEDEIAKLNGMYMLIFMGISILCVLIGVILSLNSAIIFSQGLTDNEINTVKILMILMAINIAITFISSVFDSNIIVHEKFHFQQTRQLAQTLLVPLVTIPLVISGWGVISIVISQTIIYCVFLVLNARFSINILKMRFQFNDLNFELFKELFTFSFFIFLTQIVELILNQGPSVILGMYTGTSAVATYSVALQLKNLFVMVSSTLSSIFLPHVNTLVQKQASNTQLTNLMTKVGRIQFLLMSYLIGGFILVGQEFINLWVGSTNSYSYNLLLFIMLPSIFPMAQNLGVIIQQAQNKHKFRSITYLVCSVINLTITWFLVKQSGLKYVMIGFVIYTLIGNLILMNWYYQRKMKLDMFYFWKKILILIPASALSVLFVQMMQNILHNQGVQGILLSIMMYSIIYFLIYYFFLSSEDEKFLVKSIILKLKGD